MMDDLKLDRAELMSVVPYLRSVEAGRFTWDELGQALNLEVQGHGAVASILSKGAAKPRNGGFLKDFWDEVKKEIHLLICTKNRKYTSLRKAIGENRSVGTLYVLTTITAFLAGIFGVAPALLTPLVATALFAIAQVGQNPWCEVMRKRTDAKNA